MRKQTEERIEKINQLFATYGEMTVRQIYYRLLGQLGLNYRQVCYLCKVGREEGLISPSNIVDRSRPIYGKKMWEDKKDFVEGISDMFNLDYWIDSKVRPQIWTEKDALSQVLYDVAREYNVDVYVSRGFLSISNKDRWGGSNIAVLYFGDFDPSGLFIDKDLEVSVAFENFERIALTEGMTKGLPSVPLKKKDPRTPSYVAQYGYDCGWELDALDPNKLKDLVKKSIEKYVDFDLQQKKEEESEIRRQLYDIE